MPDHDTYTLADGIRADIYYGLHDDRRTITTCELWRGPIHINTSLTRRHPNDIENEAIAATTALARALMVFYGRPSLLLHLDAIHDQMFTREYRMLLRQIAEEAAKRKQ